MKAVVPAVRAVMGRRILVNFRVRPEVIQQILPSPFRPKLVKGWGMGGICLIRLEAMRPVWLPRAIGLASENAAHRIAVVWREDGDDREGVFIPRRDTDSLLNRLAGGRLFPGVHHAADFTCREQSGHYEVHLLSHDRQTRVNVSAQLDNQWSTGSVFGSLAEASEFFRRGGCGWSCGANGGLEGVALETEDWQMQPLVIERAESSFFADPANFPRGSVEFDSALLMSGIKHRWRALGSFATSSAHQHAGKHRRVIPFLEFP